MESLRRILLVLKRRLLTSLRRLNWSQDVLCLLGIVCIKILFVLFVICLDFLFRKL